MFKQYGIVNLKFGLMLFALIGVMSMAPTVLVAQRKYYSKVDDFREVTVLSTRDTLIRERKPSALWFGVQGGGLGNLAFGNLNINPLGTTSAANRVSVTSGNGEGYYLGIVGEWQKPGNTFGGALRVNLLDRRVLNAIGSTNLGAITTGGDTITSGYQYESYSAKMVHDYISVAPEVRFTLPGTGIHFLGGLDLDFLISSTSETAGNRKDIADISHFQKDPSYNPSSFRLGAHTGVGVDIYSANVGGMARFKLTPYVTANFGTPVSVSNGSSWNTVFLRAGFSAKFSFDKTLDTIHKYDPLYVPPPVYVATVQWDRGLSSPSIRPVTRLEVAGLEYNPVEAPGIVEEPEITETPAVAEVSVPEATDIVPDISATEKESGGIAKDASAQVTPTPVRLPSVVLNKERTFTFSSFSSTSPNQAAQQYLDAVAEYLKANPGATVRISGHSDNSGTAAEQQRFSNERADYAVQYLIKKGIPKRRLFPSGLAARRSIADNRTPQGRQKNRRLEIVVVP